MAYPWIVKTTGVVNHFYVYGVDVDFGPFFLKFCSYFPYNARLCIKGHEWVKRQGVSANRRLLSVQRPEPQPDPRRAAGVATDCPSGGSSVFQALGKQLMRPPRPCAADGSNLRDDPRAQPNPWTSMTGTSRRSSKTR